MNNKLWSFLFLVLFMSILMVARAADPPADAAASAAAPAADAGGGAAADGAVTELAMPGLILSLAFGLIMKYF